MPQPTSDTLAPRTRLALGVLALLLFFGALGSYPLLEPDEGRYAEIPREMLERGDFVTPHLNGVLYFEKPPLYYWLNAAALSLPGRPEVLGRLFGALFGLAGVGLAWLLGRSVGGPRVALTAAIVLGSSPLWVALSRANIIDMTLTFFLSATLTCFWLAQAKERGEPGERLLWYGMFAAAALATLTKGLIGFVIPGAVIFFYLLFARRWRLLSRVPWLGGIAAFLVIALPWHLLAARRNPDFLWFYFVHEHFQRYATSEAKRQAPAWFFVAILAIGLLPWSGVLPAAARLFRRGEAGRLRDRPGLIFLACWAGFVFLFFSASQSKLVPYILPAIPPLAVLIALALTAAGEEPRTRSWVRVGGTVGALLLAVLAAALLAVALGQVRQASAVILPNTLVFALPALAACLLSAWLWWRGTAAEPGGAGGGAGPAGDRPGVAGAAGRLPAERRAHRPLPWLPPGAGGRGLRLSLLSSDPAGLPPAARRRRRVPGGAGFRNPAPGAGGAGPALSHRGGIPAGLELRQDRVPGAGGGEAGPAPARRAGAGAGADAAGQIPSDGQSPPAG